MAGDCPDVFLIYLGYYLHLVNLLFLHGIVQAPLISNEKSCCVLFDIFCSDKLGFYNSQAFCRKAAEQGPVV